MRTTERKAGWVAPLASMPSSPGTTGTRAATTTTAPPLSRIAGQLVFALILIVVSISALQVLGIEAIAEPATQMLTLILNAIPSVIAAALLLGIGYLISRFVAPLLESTLQGLGTDRVLADLGAGGTTGTPPSKVIARAVQLRSCSSSRWLPLACSASPRSPRSWTPSSRSPAASSSASPSSRSASLLQPGPQVRLRPGGQVLRYATIALFVAIGLGSMGLADSIVNLAFGAIVVGGAAAVALAFGLAAGRLPPASCSDSRRVLRPVRRRSRQAASATASAPQPPGGPPDAVGRSTCPSAAPRRGGARSSSGERGPGLTAASGQQSVLPSGCAIAKRVETGVRSGRSRIVGRTADCESAHMTTAPPLVRVSALAAPTLLLLTACCG